MFANDLAYNSTNNNLTLEEYKINTNSNNILKIIWRFEYDEIKHMLYPTWPVIINYKDILLNNTQPMECGIEYSWRYWSEYNKNELKV